MKRIIGTGLVTLLVCGLFAGCTDMNRTQQGILSGGAIGAIGGAGISAIAGGSAGVGALVGGGLGAVAGGLIGHEEMK